VLKPLVIAIEQRTSNKRLEANSRMKGTEMGSRRFGKASSAACVIAGLFAATDLSSAQAVRPSTLPVVRVIATGGTIAGRGASSTSLSNYQSGALLGEELVKAVPEIKQYADVRIEQLFNVNSTDLTLPIGSSWRIESTSEY